jgi:choline-sulfatase
VNTLFLMVDEMAWWAVGSAASLGAKTPNIDALAARGMVFDAAYTPSPICVPARAAIATGRDVHETGYWSSAEPYDGALPSWGHRLREVGVEVVSIGKLHYRDEGDDTGFDRQIRPLHVHEGKGWLLGLLRRPVPRYDATAELAEDLGAGWTGYTRYDLGVTEAACAWLAEPERKARPWAAFVSWLSPHYPLIAPEEFLSLYDPADYTRPAEEVPDHPILREIAGFFAHDRHFTDDTRGLAHAAYRALCTFIDAEVGKVLAALDAAGQADDTLVIFTSDHGDMMGEKGFWTKSVMYESSVRVPLIVAGPGVAPGRRVDPVSLIDIAPTISAAMGQSCAGFSGRSLLAPPEPGRSVLSEYHDGGCSVGMTMLRWQAPDGTQWKYVHYAEGHPPRLFDLTADPGETTDLATARPDIRAEAEARLAAIMDPEAVNARAHADQVRKMAEHGGRAAILGIPQWNFTKVGDS